MQLQTEYILPVDLTGYVRASLADYTANTFALAGYLPNVPIDDLDYRLTRGGTGLIEAAGFRAYDAESPIGKRKGFARISGELPPISRKLRSGEYDRLRQRHVADQTILGSLLDDADNLVRQIAAGFEVARGIALVTGVTTITVEDAGTLSVDWLRNPGNTVTAATAHTSPDADILGDLLTWQQWYSDLNGELPGSCVISQQELALIMRNPAMRNVVFPGANQPSVISVAAINEALSAFGLPPFTVYRVQVSVGGVATPVIPANRLLYLPAPGASGAPANQLGATLLGTTAESLEPDYGIVAGDQPGIVAGTYKTEDPVAYWTKAAAIGLPVLANPDLSFCATTF